MNETHQASLSRRGFIGTVAGVAGAIATGGVAAIFSGAGITIATIATSTRKLDDRDAAIVYTPNTDVWRKWPTTSPGWYQATARSSQTAGATFEITGTQCNRLRWHATKSPSRGIADVYLDGVKVTSVDQFAPAQTTTGVCWDSGELQPGTHTLRVVVTGRKSAISQGYWIENDAIEVVDVNSAELDIDDSSEAIYYVGPPFSWIAYKNHLSIPTRFNKTIHFAQLAGSSFSYTHRLCSRIKWYAARRPDGGVADVFIDGVAVGSVDLYSATVVENSVIFDSGPLAPGVHTIRVAVTGTAQAASTGKVVEVDRLRVTAVPDEFDRINDDNIAIITYSGAATAWSTATGVAGATNRESHRSSTAGAAAAFSFDGTKVRWVGSTGPDHGVAEIEIDGQLAGTVDCYSPTFSASTQLFESADLASSDTHNLRVLVTGRRNPSSTGSIVSVDAFECATARTIQLTMSAAASAERLLTAAGTKPYLAPTTWTPIGFAAAAPQHGVRLLPDTNGTDGAIRTAFTRNMNYLRHANHPARTNFIDSNTRAWVSRWPSSNEGRMLMGAGHALQWLDESSADAADMRAIVDRVMAIIVSRTHPSRLPWATDENAALSNMGDKVVAERANYDRAMWVRGLIAAINSGDSQAPQILRDHADWFNGYCTSQLGKIDALYTKSLGVQGHIASTLTFHSSVGTDADLVTADRMYTQDWWIQWLNRREPAAIWRYPHNRPHSYLLLGGEAFLDHYRATGATKYLDASLGMWDIFQRYFQFTGGVTSISEVNPYHPSSHYMHIFNNEFDGSIFWALFNSRLSQHFPDNERYAHEIERSIYNGTLGQQHQTAVDATYVAGTDPQLGAFTAGSGQVRETIRYHGFMNDKKEDGKFYNTCCEVNGAGFYSRLPEFVYSVAADGVFVNQYASSSIAFDIDQQPVTLTTSTNFPFDMAVSHTISTSSDVAMVVRVRVPAWATAAVAVNVNGTPLASGTPGSFVALDRTWSDGDTVSYSLPAGFRLTRYTGQARVAGLDRYALEYGPILMAAVGAFSPGLVDQFDKGTVRIPVAAADLVAALQPTATPLNFSVAGAPGVTFRPYWTVVQERMSVFPVLG